VTRIDVFGELDIVEGALEERLVVVNVCERYLQNGGRTLWWVTLKRKIFFFDEQLEYGSVVLNYTFKAFLWY
jgi:hypothetical protein